MAAVAALTAALCSLTAPLVIARRTDNSFMIGLVLIAMVAILLTEGIFLGKLIGLAKTK